MHFTKEYNLFLLDFDGLLVNTEKLHYTAYKNMCKAYGFCLDWEFAIYCRTAMSDSTALKNALLKEFPELKAFSWDELYKKKKKCYLEVLENEKIELMPGVHEFLSELAKRGLKRSVVTNSPKEQIDFIRQKLPILDSIPFWITREHYSKPKPDSECYVKAIEMYADKGEKVVGFEDSPRGLKALLGSGAHGVMISSIYAKKEVLSEVARDFSHYSSFEEFSKG